MRGEGEEEWEGGREGSLLPKTLKPDSGWVDSARHENINIYLYVCFSFGDFS